MSAAAPLCAACWSVDYPLVYTARRFAEAPD